MQRPSGHQQSLAKQPPEPSRRLIRPKNDSVSIGYAWAVPQEPSVLEPPCICPIRLGAAETVANQQQNGGTAMDTEKCPPFPPETTKGFAALNIKCSPQITEMMSREAVGSPQLMQYFCWELCFERGVDRTSPTPIRIPPKFSFEQIFERIAKDMGQPIYDRLAAGPQSRTNRIDRPLKVGDAVDIYQALLLAISATGPKKSLSYDEIRASLSAILKEKVPQKIEVSNALKQIAKISAA